MQPGLNQDQCPVPQAPPPPPPRLLWTHTCTIAAVLASHKPPHTHALHPTSPPTHMHHCSSPCNLQLSPTSALPPPSLDSRPLQGRFEIDPSYRNLVVERSRKASQKTSGVKEYVDTYESHMQQIATAKMHQVVKRKVCVLVSVLVCVLASVLVCVLLCVCLCGGGEGRSLPPQRCTRS